MKKLLALALTLACLFLYPACVMAEGLAIVDGMGREVRFDQPPQTCVSLTPANTEILFALGVDDRLLGVDNQSDYPAEAEAVESRLGDYYAPSIEAIVQLNPDVVFASNKLQMEAIQQLDALGFKVVCNDPTSLADITPGIEMVAKVMDVDAGEITGAIDTALKNAADAQSSGGKVYFALSFGEYGNYTAGPGTFIDEMISLCGGENVAGKSPVAWPEYTLEQLVQDDPDLILVSDHLGDGSLVEQLKTTPGYDTLRCVGQGRVYAVDANIVSRPGPRIGEGLAAIADAMRMAADQD